MSIWAELKKVVNDNFAYPLNKQHFYPVNFNTTAEYFEESTTYTAQQTGVYIITCVGKGGNGTSSTAGYGWESANSVRYASSGGGGAVCKGYVILQAGQTISITVDASKSSFGTLIAAGAGQNGTISTSSVSAAAGGTILTAGNIVNHAGYSGVTGNLLNLDLKGGNAGIITPWSLNDGWSQGYLPFINWTEMTGGDSEANGKFGGGHGGGNERDRGGVRGGGGYGGGGNWNKLASGSSGTIQYASYSQGGKGVVIVEHGVMIYG